MENLKDILKEVKSYKTLFGMPGLTDDMILDCATRIFISNNISNQRTSKSSDKSESSSNEKPSDPNAATPNQKYALVKMGYKKEDVEKMSKKEAYQIIKEKKGKKENNFPDY